MKWIICIIIVCAITVFFIVLKSRQDKPEANFQIRFSGKKIKIMDKYALYIAKRQMDILIFEGSAISFLQKMNCILKSI